MREAGHRHDERIGLWRRCSAGLIARYAGGMRRGQVPLSGCGLWTDQQYLDPAQSGGLADREELLFTARIVGAEEAYRIGLLNHLVPRAQLRAKTMELAKMIAANHRGAVVGVKALMLQQMGLGLEEQFNAEHEYTTHVLRGAKAKDAFPEFMARKGLA